jgi:hypothetical protein
MNFSYRIINIMIYEGKRTKWYIRIRRWRISSVLSVNSSINRIISHASFFTGAIRTEHRNFIPLETEMYFLYLSMSIIISLPEFLYKIISTSFSSLPCNACRICLTDFSFVSLPYRNSHVQGLWIISERE